LLSLHAEYKKKEKMRVAVLLQRESALPLSADKHEIWLVLNDMKTNSSPDPDGFNVEFYLAT
jgi:hypothetical protein